MRFAPAGQAPPPCTVILRGVYPAKRGSGLLAKVPGLWPDASSSNAYEIIPPGR